MKNLIILLLMVFNFAYADIKIIASSACRIEVVAKSDIKNLFMLKKSLISGESITIIDSSEKTTYKDFLKKYMNKTPRRMKTYWIRMLFTGKKIPPQKLSLDELNSLDDTEFGCYLSYTIDEVSKPKDWKIVTIR